MKKILSALTLLAASACTIETQYAQDALIEQSVLDAGIGDSRTQDSDPEVFPEGLAPCLEEAFANESTRPYAEFLHDSPDVSFAVGLCYKPPELQEHIWQSIIEAERTGQPPEVPLPLMFGVYGNSRLGLDRNEAFQIFGARIAHSLWVEINGIVPWSLLDYSIEQLDSILSPRVAFAGWDVVGGNFSMKHLADYSPHETFRVATQAVLLDSMTNQETAIVDIIRSARQFRHGDSSDISRIQTVGDMHDGEVSIFGCHSMALYILRLTSILNIPGEDIRGYYGANDHRTAGFPYTNQILGHGDHVYNSYLANTDSRDVLDAYDFWDRHVLAHGRNNDEGGFNSLLHPRRMMVLYPARKLQDVFCSYERGTGGFDRVFGSFDTGLDYLEWQFGDYVSPLELDELNAKLLLLTTNCTMRFPDTAQ